MSLTDAINALQIGSRHFFGGLAILRESADWFVVSGKRITNKRFRTADRAAVWLIHNA